jgi:hypothetical protein
VADTGVGALDGLGVLGGGHPADAVLVAIVTGLRGGETEFLVGVPANA